MIITRVTSLKDLVIEMVNKYEYGHAKLLFSYPSRKNLTVQEVLTLASS